MCAQVAVRSEEPYRLQCYGFLAAAAAPDIMGIASAARPVLPILDALYATRATLERLADKHGPRAQRCALSLELLPAPRGLPSMKANPRLQGCLTPCTCLAYDIQKSGKEKAGCMAV